jgi:murein DD-endopeptidase MepM/ murein hydrolase activator NlpD
MRRRSARIFEWAVAAAGAVAFALGSAPSSAEAAGEPVGAIVAVDTASVIVREAPAADAARVAVLDNGAAVTVQCQVIGDNAAGRVRTTDRWDRLQSGGYIADAHIERDEAKIIRLCATDAPAADRPAAEAPVDRVAEKPAAALPADASPVDTVTVPASTTSADKPAETAPEAAPAPAIKARTKKLPEQNVTPLAPIVGDWVQPVGKVDIGGFRTPTRPQHDGVDLMAARGSPIAAAASGLVITVKCNSSLGNCDVDGSPSVKGCGWYVEIRHTDDVVTRYCHMGHLPSVKVGDKVTVGQVIGFVGSSGNSSGPHLHFEVHLGKTASHANAVDPMPFMQQMGAPLSHSVDSAVAPHSPLTKESA